MTVKKPSKSSIIGKTLLNNWEVVEEIDSGNNGVVYRAAHTAEEVDMDSACKLMPIGDLTEGWEKEVEKATMMDTHPNVVSIKDYTRIEIDKTEYACVISEFVDGPSLLKYIQDKPDQITVSFVCSVAEAILDVLHGMERREINHNDLHTGNVLLSKSDITISDEPQIKITDFGIGGSRNSMQPKNDYAQLGDIILDLLSEIDRSKLDTLDEYRYEFLVDEFVAKYIVEEDPTKGEYVRSPQELQGKLKENKSKARERMGDKPTVELQSPFDYLSCEQMGDSFRLIEKLYSRDFPGYGQLHSRTNTLLTGPRGCGKTTILKNMDLETQLETGQIKSADEIDYFGIFYPCRDLYFAFHYMDDKDPSSYNQNLLIHYLSLSLLKKFINRVRLLRDQFGNNISEDSLRLLEENISRTLRDYSSPPAGTDVLDHLTSVLEKEKRKVDDTLRRGESGYSDETRLMGIDRLPKTCKNFINSVDWLKNTPLFFLVDDYSLPKITQGMQSTLNDLVMERWDQVYFKISTESIASFHPYDRSEKLLEESREFEVVDLANHFISNTEKRNKFLTEVLNTRLETTSGIHSKYTDIYEILGERPYDSYNDLARQLRSDSDVDYAGFETLRDMFSGDISEMLRLVRGMFNEVGQNKNWEEGSVEVPIPPQKQDEVIKRYGGSFLNKIESIPESGERLREVAEAFGQHANQLLMEKTSKNETGNPPLQAFRIEIRDSFSFDSDEHVNEVLRVLRRNTSRRPEKQDISEEAESIYNDLLQYGIFLLDTRGKSIRGGAVPRLYLRRLLLPKFNLTPSQRDNVSLEPAEFMYLLSNPEGYDASDFERSETESLSRFIDDSDEKSE
ncbi:protein kinase [Natrinema salinisoli]|uniref:ORC-CDC6 family AAA ATPase n=1 Tax=Natrinema salinisoli TaxID=2878535 RepID=UPI001CF0A3AA|nr:protein kinase [Natrinema salinisoli]